MELEEYLQDNNVTLWRNNRALGPQQTKSLADFDYAEGLENITGKMVWICDYRANADPTKKPIRGIEPTPVVVTDAKETNKTIYYSPIYYREDTTVGYEQYLLIFENKDTIYDICDAVRCTKALYMAAQNDFNNVSLETLNAAAKILGVKYDKVKRK